MKLSHLYALTILTPASAFAGLVDITAPELLRLTISPNTVDVTSGEQIVDVTFEFSDNLSGLDYMYLGVDTPSGTYIDTAFAYPDTWSDHLISGDTLGGVLETSFTIPQYSESGDYTYSVYLEDKNNNYSYLGYDDLVSMGFGNLVSVGSITSVNEPNGLMVGALGLMLFAGYRRRAMSHV